MHQMTLAEHSYPRNMMVQNSLLPFFPIPFGNTKKMEHHRTRSLWSLLCNYQVELLSPGRRYYSLK